MNKKQHIILWTTLILLTIFIQITGWTYAFWTILLLEPILKRYA